MLSPDRKRLTGKLLLSSALVAVSLVYGWWQQHDADRKNLAMLLPPSAPKVPVPVPPVTAPAAPIPSAAPDADAAADASEGSSLIAPAPQKTVATAKAAPQAAAVTAPAAAEAQQNIEPPPSPPIVQPAPPVPSPADIAPAPFLVTGAPPPGVMPAIAAGAHLEDGDYVSDKHQLMWGDIRVKIFVRGGLITGVQTLEYPDHRSQSLYLSQMALPILESEVIKNQKSQVDTVSSATDTGYSFQDAVANAIMRATRG